MEGVKARRSVAIALVFLIVCIVHVEPSESQAKNNYWCFLKCALSYCLRFGGPPPGPPVMDPACEEDCANKCASHPFEVSKILKNDPHHLCQFGCVVSVCSPIITGENPASDKIEGCVESCDTTCSKHC
ncbi:thionin-like protein 2 [Beta vulgaris subsp. vulgaris]|uniref:thionin-like protein 2 n=1 Tax=Beta vulgaris subsp. vulgaris TaxID=3555 RepID=UPI00053FB480|nr:thionin-like protein 2 [Beta vulgaris subsp. vulgaris]